MAAKGDEGNQLPSLATEAVLVTSSEMEAGSEEVQGYDFNKGIDHHNLLKSFKHSGFQATNFGLAVEEIWKMIKCRREAIPEDKTESRYKIRYFYCVTHNQLFAVNLTTSRTIAPSSSATRATWRVVVSEIPSGSLSNTKYVA